MDEDIRSVYWETPEHRHIEKTDNWSWIVGILALAGSVAAIILNNVLFGIVIILGAFTMILVGHKKPRIVECEVGPRGIRIQNSLYPYATLESYFLDETNTVDPQIIIKSKKLFMSLIIVPVPVEYVDEIENIVGARLPEEHLVEPFEHRLMEYLGF